MSKTNFKKNHDLNSALEAATKQKVWEWVLEFLRFSEGPNLGLATKLEHEGHYHYGPINYPLSQLKNIIGPDSSFKYVEEEEKLATKVEQMYLDIKKGWQPPPIIATNFWEPYLEISDGGHRQRALLKAGIKKYPTIFFFRSKQEMDEFIEKHKL